MSVAVEALFTNTVGLQPPWAAENVKRDTTKRLIDFEIGCQAKALARPACWVFTQHVHDRLRRSWRHPDFFKFEARLHCDVPLMACSGCGKTRQAGVAWARPGLGFRLHVRRRGHGPYVVPGSAGP